MLFVYFEDDLDDSLDYALSLRASEWYGDEMMMFIQAFLISKVTVEGVAGEWKADRKIDGENMFLCCFMDSSQIIWKGIVIIQLLCQGRNLWKMMRCRVWFHVSPASLSKSRLETCSKLFERFFLASLDFILSIN